jgi:hypothetical protein
MKKYNHFWSGIGTHYHSVQAGEDIFCILDRAATVIGLFI